MHNPKHRTEWKIIIRSNSVVFNEILYFRCAAIIIVLAARNEMTNCFSLHLYIGCWCHAPKTGASLSVMLRRCNTTCCRRSEYFRILLVMSF